mgnify:FL=1
MVGRARKRKKMVIESLVGSQTAVSGNIGFLGGLHIDGYVKGDVEAEPGTDSVLSISEGGTVEGNVKVPDVFLKGTVKGDVTTTSRVELGPTAKVIGNVYYNLIEMAIGAEIDGKLIDRVPDASAVADDGASGGDDSEPDPAPFLGRQPS